MDNQIITLQVLNRLINRAEASTAPVGLLNSAEKSRIHNDC
jgi:hypothetical protein